MNNRRKNNRIVDRHRLRQMVLLSLSSVTRLEKRGEFPRRILLSPSRVGWLEDDVLYWVDCKREGRVWTQDQRD